MKRARAIAITLQPVDPILACWDSLCHSARALFDALYGTPKRTQRTLLVAYGVLGVMCTLAQFVPAAGGCAV